MRVVSPLAPFVEMLAERRVEPRVEPPFELPAELPVELPVGPLFELPVEVPGDLPGGLPAEQSPADVSCHRLALSSRWRPSGLPDCLLSCLSIGP